MKKQLPAWIVLGIIALVAGCALGFTNELTSPVIAEQTVAAAAEARRTVLPEAVDFEELTLEAGSALDNCYKATANGADVGYTGQITVKGYGGDIEVVVGVDSTGTITGINVGGANFAETAGLGAKAKEPEFTEQFKGLTAPLTLKGNVDSVTGASITSGAVVDGVNAILDYVASIN